MKIENIIKKKIKKSKNIFVVAHKNLDLDALGSCIGVVSIGSHFHKKSYIILDDEKHELSVTKVLNQIKEDYQFIKSTEISKYHYKNSILFVVDVNKSTLLQSDKIISYFDTVIILDHHQETNETITTNLKIIDEEVSSACELVTNLISKYHIKLSPKASTSILAGIVLDTNNFIIKTTANTYKASYFLAQQNASPEQVQSFLKQDINEYILRQKVINEVKVINNKYAVSVAPKTLKYKREELAKIADTLLQFDHIQASFVLGNRNDGGIGLSARSDGIINVGKIAQTLGGGGDKNDAAAQIMNKKLEEVEEELIMLLK